MDTVNQKIIQAIIDKADRVCPHSLALIGIYGSVATGDLHNKSDLDLLLLVEDGDGMQLATGFILEDRQVGYDLYCTTRAALRNDAKCHHAHLSKLLDSRIVYIRNQAAYDELCALQTEAKAILASDLRFQRANEALEKAKLAYADACLRETVGQVRAAVAQGIACLLDAVMLYHGSYFRRGVKRTFDELAALPLDGTFVQTIGEIVSAKEISLLRKLQKHLILYVEEHIQPPHSKAKPSRALAGTYEEMYSNWRNKVEEAAEHGDPFASFMNLCGLHGMLAEIAKDVEIGEAAVMDEYSPDALWDNVQVFDRYLQAYEQIYGQAGLSVNRFADVDRFVADYIGTKR